MKPGVTGLIEAYRAQRSAELPLVLATIVAAQGSTYRKPGARMLIGTDGHCFGLLGGGCFENDLVERARQVLADGCARIAHYDMRAPDDAIWGLGLGCNGAVRVLLQRVAPDNGWQPLAALEAAVEKHCACVIATIIATSAPGALGNGVLVAGDAHETGALPSALRRIVVADASESLRERRSRVLTRHAGGIEATIFYDCVLPPPHVLILGAGVDASPVARFAAGLGWRTTVADHRPETVQAFSAAQAVLTATPERIAEVVAAEDYSAAVVMSHKLDQDRLYLAALARSEIPYVALLGPAARRQALLDGLGAMAQRLAQRSFGPAGLDIGAETPEEIALAIVAGIQAFLAGRSGGLLCQSGASAVSARPR